MGSFTEWEWFVQQFKILSSVDLTAYKRPQMERRINSFMRTVNVSNYKKFIDILSSDKDIYIRFLKHITINVSEFFRNPRHWSILEREIIPLLLRERKSLKIWSAGCSTGEEAYSLAMLFEEKRVNLTDKILATDIDREVLKKAGEGVYTAKAVQNVPPNYISKYFTRDGDVYRVVDRLKERVSFRYQDLLRDRFNRGYDIILCRNVVIYFTEEAKQVLYQKFADALSNRGILFIGSTEQIFQAKDLNLQPIATFFYQKYGL